MTFRTLPLVLVTLLVGVSTSWGQSTTTGSSQTGAPTGAQTGTQSPPNGTPSDTEPAGPPVRNVAIDPTDLLAGQTGWSLLLSGFGGNDSTNWGSAGANVLTGDDFVMNGGNAGGTARVTGSKSSPRGRYFVDGNATSVYYPSGDRFLTDTRLQLTGTRVLAQRTELTAAQTMMYAPFYGIGLFPSLGSYSGTDITSAYSPTIDSGTQTAEVFRYFMNTQLTHTMLNRAEVSVHYGLRRNEVFDRTPATFSQEVGGRYEKKINRTLGYHLGYDYGTMRYGGPGAAALNIIDVGLDVDRSLSFSRRTVFQFTSATAIVKANALDAAQADQARTNFRLLGSANLRHYLGRSWVMNASYVRDVQTLDGLATPYFTDGLNVGLSGRLGTVSTAGVSMGYLTGVPLTTSDRARDRALVSSAWLQRRLSSRVAGYARFSSYSQRFNYDQLDAIGLGDRLSKYSIRVGVNVVYSRNRATR